MAVPDADPATVIQPRQQEMLNLIADLTGEKNQEDLSE